MTVTSATIVDVTLRDGLQDEPVLVPTSAKLEIASRLARAGVQHMEVTSFVSPRRVPQMADAEKVVLGLPPGIRPAALIMNERGLQRAIAAFGEGGYRRDSYDLVYVISASERHSLANSGVDIETALSVFESVASDAASAGCHLRGSISCAFGSPWGEERIDAHAVLAIAERFLMHGCRSITLCDTVGCAQPAHVASLVREFMRHLGRVPALHLHDFAGRALENAQTALACGVTRFEGALCGLGGCPFAPKAPGNIDLAVLVGLLQGHGNAMHIDLDQISRAAQFVQQTLAAARGNQARTHRSR
ncbi:MAG TPA: hydroxymethylglutaryl-CoA lyase [Steroidobacter sp.]|jgi:hydroxymethylglutaryl-CoA lyase